MLLLLHCNEAHGYELSEGLLQFGYEKNPADSSTVYRTLRSLEEGGFVTSRWDTDSAGPARRLYKITQDGDEYLAWWVQDLHETERVLRRFSEMYEAHMENHQ